MAVLDGVVHRFLRNMVKMRGRRGIMDQDCGFALKPAIDAE